MNNRILIVMAVVLAAIGSQAANAQPARQTIELGNRREIFVDDHLVEKLNGVSIVMHHPHDEGPVLHFDKPWEREFCAYFTIIKDGHLFRAYYRGSIPTQDKPMEVTCYAESLDGIHWVKPELGLYDIGGTRDNNVVLAYADPVSHNFSPFLDANPDRLPGQRFKALGGYTREGLFAYASADGIHWEKMNEGSVLNGAEFDSQNVAFWSEAEQKYLSYFRTYSNGFYKGYRAVSRAVSDDFVNWSEHEKMTFGDTPVEDLYTQQTSPYFRAPHIYVAIGGRFMLRRQVVTEEQARALNVNPNYFKDCSDVYFMTSRGGTAYNRTFMEAFIRPGIGMSNWVSRTNYPAMNVVQTGPEEMSLYVNQDYAQPTAHLRRYSMRLDGFTSVQAPYSGGELLTKAFTFTGNTLEINYSTSAPGEIRIEIQDEKGRPAEGFKMEECDTIIGNEICRKVTWNGSGDVASLAGKNIRLRIYMKDADLYSIRFF